MSDYEKQLGFPSRGQDSSVERTGSNRLREGGLEESKISVGHSSAGLLTSLKPRTMPVQCSVQTLYGIVYRPVRDFVQRTISILFYISIR